MLSYNLKEIKLADLKNLFYNNKYFKIHSQQKLLTKRVDSLSYNYSES